MNVDIKAHSAPHTPAYALVHEAISEMVQEGISPEPGIVFPIEPTDMVLHAEHEGEAIGVLAYRIKGHVHEVILAYVEPSSRRSHVMSKLWAHMLRANRGGEIRVKITTNNRAGAQFLRARNADLHSQTFTVEF